MGLSSTKITLLSLPFLLPFVYIPFLWNPYEFSKFLLFIILVQIFVIIFVLKKIKQKKRSSLFSFDLLSITALLFLAVTFLSDVFGLDAKVSILGSAYRHQGFVTVLASVVYFFLVRELVIKERKDVFGKVLVIGAVSGFFISLISLWHAVSFYGFYDISIPTFQNRIVGTFGNPNFLGGYLAMLLPFVLFGKSSIKILLAAVMILAIILTGSRGAILSAVVIMLIHFLNLIKDIVYREKYSASIQVILYIFIILLALYYNDTYHYSDKLFGTRKSSIWDNRILIWTEGVKAVIKRPILGYGQENFELVFPEERLVKVDNAHNIFLEVVVSSGIVGLVLFLAIIGVALKKAFWPVKLSIIAFLISAQFNPLSISQIALFWFLLGLVPVQKD